MTEDSDKMPMRQISDGDLKLVQTFVGGANCTCECNDEKQTARICFTCRVTEILDNLPTAQEVRVDAFLNGLVTLTNVKSYDVLKELREYIVASSLIITTKKE